MAAAKVAASVLDEVGVSCEGGNPFGFSPPPHLLGGGSVSNRAHDGHWLKLLLVENNNSGRDTPDEYGKMHCMGRKGCSAFSTLLFLFFLTSFSTMEMTYIHRQLDCMATYECAKVFIYVYIHF